MTDLLFSFNIHPDAVIGHSSGEIAAAYAAGALSFDACMAIAYHRGRATIALLQSRRKISGAMLAVGAGPEEIQDFISGLTSGQTQIACFNSPESVTISGDVAAIEELQQKLEEHGMFNRKLKVDVAYHSHHMVDIAEDYHQSIESIRPLRPCSTVKYYSSLRGQEIDTSELDAQYWVDNLVSPVRFSNAMSAILTDFHKTDTSNVSRPNIALEIGPHAALEGPSRQIYANLSLPNQLIYETMLRRNKDAVLTVQNAAARLFMRGVEVNFSETNQTSLDYPPPTLLNDLPGYPFQHDVSYWHEPRIARQYLHKAFPRNQIIGVLADYSSDLAPQWRNVISLNYLPWLSDHRMQGVITFPMGGFIAMVVEAAIQKAILRNRSSSEKVQIRDLFIDRPLVLAEDAEVEIVIGLNPLRDGTRYLSDTWDEFAISSWTSQVGWVEHCRGLVLSGKDNNSQSKISAGSDWSTHATPISPDKLASDYGVHCDKIVDHDSLYKSLAEMGAIYGKTFQGLQGIRVGENRSVSDIVVPDTAIDMPYRYEESYNLHPALVDICIQTIWPIFAAAQDGLDSLHMPLRVSHITVDSSLFLHRAHSRLRAYSAENYSFQGPERSRMFSIAVTGVDAGNDPVLFEMRDLAVVTVDRGSHISNPLRLCYRLEWHPFHEEDGQTCGTSNPSNDSEENQANNLCEVPKCNGAGMSNDTSSLAGTSFYLLDSPVTIVYRGCRQFSLALKLSRKLDDLMVAQSVCLQKFDKCCDNIDGIIVMLVELDQPLLATMTEQEFTTMHRLILGSLGVLWVTGGLSEEQRARNPDFSIVTGFARSIRVETGKQFVTFDVNGQISLSTSQEDEIIAPILDIFHRCFSTGISTDSQCDMEYRWHSGQLLVPRITDDILVDNFVQQEVYKETIITEQTLYQPTLPLKMTIGTPGDLDTLYFSTDQEPATPLAAGEVEIEIQATGLNFKDVMIAMNQLSIETIGIECSGVVSRVGNDVVNICKGDRVCGVTTRAYSRYTRCRNTNLHKIPPEMSFETAASIPVAFCTAFHSLIDIGRLSRGESVLIHGAAGGLGLAAVQLAQWIGAETFVTVGSDSKKQFLVEVCNIPEDHISYSRDASFGSAVRKASKAEGESMWF